MCIICSDPRSTAEEIRTAERKHRINKLQAQAIIIKELIGDCRRVIKLNTEAGTRDEETEKYLEKLLKAQYELSREI